MGEINEFDDAVHQGVAKSDERVQNSVAEPREGDLEEL